MDTIDVTPPLEFRGPGGVLPIHGDDRAAVDLAMLLAGETSGRPLAEVLAQFGQSRSTYYAKLRRYVNLGLEGLRPRQRGPRRPWVRTVKVLQAVVRARLLDPTRSAASISASLAQQGLAVSVRSVERVLTDFGLSAGSARGP